MPKIRTKRIMVRGKNDREWKDVPTAGSGVYPVTKSEKMTAAVGRDEHGRLWTAPDGLSNTYIRTLTGDTGRVGYMLIIDGKDGRRVFTMLPETTIVSDVYVDPAGVQNGVFWYNPTADELHIKFGGWCLIYKKGATGLPAITDADEDKVLRIKGGKAVWASLINGEEVKF